MAMQRASDHDRVSPMQPTPAQRNNCPSLAENTTEAPEKYDDKAEASDRNETEQEEYYPDGGLQAWLVVLGAWCAMIPSMGLLNTIGVLQAWVAEHQLENFSESNIGWIFSTYAFFLYITGVQVGPIFDSHGVKPLVIPGSIGIVAAVMCLSVCEEYYQFLLSFGVLGGMSSSLLFNPSISSIGHWFNERRALATGIACTAGGTGGVVFPLIVLYLGPRIGFPWAIRIIGFICAGMCITACLCLRTRLPPNKKAGATIDIKALKETNYALTTAAIFLIEFAVFIPLTYISSYAIHVGVEPQYAYRLISLLNVGSILGRALPGYVADRWGRFNVMALTSTVCAAFIFALWLTSGAKEPAITAFVVIFGFWSGAAISLTPVCVSQVCRVEDYGKRNGTTFAISSFGALIGIPIAGALLNVNDGDYLSLIVFAGAMYLAAAVAFVVARGVAGGWNPRLIF